MGKMKTKINMANVNPKILAVTLNVHDVPV